MEKSKTKDERRGLVDEFADDMIASLYTYRPPYPQELMNFLLTLSRKKERALDLGSGPGKITFFLAEHFSKVVAVEPSKSMVSKAKLLDSGRHGNITWFNGRAEDYSSEDRFDLTVAGNSIQWMDHGLLFPKLSVWTEVLAVVNGDEPDPPPCGEKNWNSFLNRWLAVMHRVTPSIRKKYDPGKFRNYMERYRDNLKIEGEKKFTGTVKQTVNEFILSQHSRATWSIRTMGSDLAGKFDRELRSLLTEYAEDGVLTLSLKTELVWGKPVPL